jgi:hypothetical protein
MKIRNGFISNSSSSSFVIAIKAPAAANVKDALYRGFGIDPKSPAALFFQPIFDHIVDGKWMNFQEFLDDFGYDSIEDLEKTGSSWEREYGEKLAELEKDGWRAIRVQGRSDECDAPNQFFYAGVPEIDTPTLKVFEG